jgi:hypothetical protein
MKVVGEMSTYRTFVKIHQKSFKIFLFRGKFLCPWKVYHNEKNKK